MYRYIIRSTTEGSDRNLAGAATGIDATHAVINFENKYESRKIIKSLARRTFMNPGEPLIDDSQESDVTVEVLHSEIDYLKYEKYNKK